jgi:ERCC4-type nuclease
VGEKRKGRLLRHFGSIHRISEATESELTPFVGKKTAHEIVDHFARQRALAGGQPGDETSELPSNTPVESVNQVSDF